MVITHQYYTENTATFKIDRISHSVRPAWSLVPGILVQREEVQTLHIEDDQMQWTSEERSRRPFIVETYEKESK